MVFIKWLHIKQCVIYSGSVSDYSHSDKGRQWHDRGDINSFRCDSTNYNKLYGAEHYSRGHQ
jgi:hypothetical protein